MRGGTWSSVKPILKILNESFATFVHMVYIINPDNFWQKQRTSLGSQKYKFEVRKEDFRNSLHLQFLSSGNGVGCWFSGLLLQSKSELKIGKQEWGVRIRAYGIRLLAGACNTVNL
jgi:hypothetical protein